MRELRAGDPTRIGDFALVARLGRGAMGTVFLGRSPGGRPVAVKVARAELADDPAFRARFRQEIDMARAVGGFWTAAVVGADPDAERPWLATEYVAGPTLSEAVSTNGPLAEPVVRALMAGLAEALAAIHGAGLVHRDLKPSNVLLAADGPRVIDFGIAKAVRGAGLTLTGMVFGTPGYLSPEQISGTEVGPACDVFALGAVMVFAATGRGPFGEGEIPALLYRAVHTGPDLTGVPRELRPVVSRCLNVRPELRPTPADLLAEAGTATTGDWLPGSVLAMVDERTTALRAHPAPRRPTLVDTPSGADPARVADATAAARAAESARAADSARAARAAEEARTAAAARAERVRLATAKAAELVRARTAAASAPAVFAKSRLPDLARALLVGCGAVVFGVGAAYGVDRGDHALAAGLTVATVLMALSALRSLYRVLRAKPRSVEISPSGLVIRDTADSRTMAWSEIGRVELVADGRETWLVVWPRDPKDQAGGLGKRHSRRHGGFRVLPVRGPRQIDDLSDALQRHGGRLFVIT
ncbi:serine/threonine-protein kinase [Actinokineospora auranticolor]|uniref:serine/threonine-protein kinase n=1 Tax=Actinokineospora auranticolor TaxID=155976 RepID=UPI001FE704CB|nr:serine/threonine-protein kinase [Actinokineospora auranticolor]